MDNVIQKRVERATEQQSWGNPDFCLIMVTWTYDFEVNNVGDDVEDVWLVQMGDFIISSRFYF